MLQQFKDWCYNFFVEDYADELFAKSRLILWLLVFTFLIACVSMCLGIYSTTKVRKRQNSKDPWVMVPKDKIINIRGQGYIPIRLENSTIKT